MSDGAGWEEVGFEPEEAERLWAAGFGPQEAARLRGRGSESR